jgi:hypothetical protein
LSLSDTQAIDAINLNHKLIWGGGSRIAKAKRENTRAEKKKARVLSRYEVVMITRK